MPSHLTTAFLPERLSSRLEEMPSSTKAPENKGTSLTLLWGLAKSPLRPSSCPALRPVLLSLASAACPPRPSFLGTLSFHRSQVRLWRADLFSHCRATTLGSLAWVPSIHRSLRSPLRLLQLLVVMHVHPHGHITKMWAEGEEY